MSAFAHNPAEIIGIALLAIAAGYEVVALAAVLTFRAHGATRRTDSWTPAVTVLKPLCGAEAGLYENLRSFCRQEFPRFEIVFGVRDAADPALAVVKRLQAEFPALDMTVVVNPRQHGSNRKVSNLINMLEHARYDVLAIVDSDAGVEPDYLCEAIAPLADERTGLVTCTYRSVPTHGAFSSLGAMYVNEWYMPSVLLAWLFGHRGYASGQTLCLRRDTLDAIGGLQQIADHLADDYMLGELIRKVGLKIVLSPYLPRIAQDDPSLQMLLAHEIRWMRTIRALRPRSFAFLFMSFSLPLAIVGMLLSVGAANLPLVLILFSATVAARLGLFLQPRIPGNGLKLSELWLIPVRDLLLCWVWMRTLFTSRISWRGGEFDVDAEGVMRSPS
jgi:ceramide glucosyltransferase